MSVEQRTTAAAGMLRALGIVDSFAPVILITGHAAKVENNAFAAATTAGPAAATAGTSTHASWLRSSTTPVRRQLAEVHGITVPDSTAAVPAAQHHHRRRHDRRGGRANLHRAKVAELQAHLTAAQTGCLRERMAELPA